MQRLAITPGHGIFTPPLGQPDYLLIRETTLPIPTLLDFARQARAALPQTKILISERPDIALAAALDGVHLTSAAGQLTPAQIHKIFPAAIISRSIHNLTELPPPGTCDLLLFGPVFGKFVDGKMVVPPAGLDALAEVCRKASPASVFALGNVTERSYKACLDAGAAAIASIRLFYPDISTRYISGR